MKTVDDIDRQAALWVARLDVSPRPAVLDAEFQAWIEADIRHRVAYLRHNASWQKTQLLERLRPLEGRVDADLLAAAPRRSRLHWWAATAAAVAVLCVTLFAIDIPQLWGEKVYVTGIGNYQRIYLQDGSSIELNTNSKVRVKFTERNRRIQLLRGEAKFQVAHAADRPFDVVGGESVIRAVGTAFSVRVHDGEHVEVVVTEGRVVVVPARAAEQISASVEGPKVAAGQAATIASDAVTVQQLAAPVVARRLAWTTGKLVFDNEPLAHAASEFNRYNKVQLSVPDPALGDVRISGSFDVSNVASFLAAMERVFAVRAESAGEDELILVRAKPATDRPASRQPG